MNELVSVIIPVYNTEKYIKRCIKSVINQSYKNLEIIVVDDGTTDTSGAIADAFLEIDNRIQVIHKMNEGVAVARNIGIDISKGQYVVFLDSDDCIDKNMIEVMLNKALETDSQIVVCGIKQIFEEKFSDIKVCEHELTCSTNKMGPFFLNDSVAYSSVNKMYKKQLLHKIRYPKLRMCEDAVFLRNLYKNCSRVTLLPECFYYNYQRDDSATKKGISDKSFYDTIQAIEIMDGIENLNWEGDSWAQSPRVLLFELVMALLLNREKEKIRYIRNNSHMWKILRKLKLQNTMAENKKKIVVLLLRIKLYNLLLFIIDIYVRRSMHED